MIQPYVGGYGPEDARIMVVGEAIASYEEQAMQCWVGPTAQDFMRMCNEVKLNPLECYFTNVIRHKPQTVKGKLDLTPYITWKKKEATPGMTYIFGAYVSDTMLHHMSDLRKEIEIIKPTLIIAAGAVPLWALTKKTGITKWRGSELWLDWPDCNHKCKVIPTFNPAYLINVYSARRLIINDLQRAKRESRYTELSEQPWDFVIRPSYEVVTQCLLDLLDMLTKGSLTLYTDIETRGGQIACVGIAFSKTEAICIPIMCVERRAGYWSFEQEVEIVWLLKQIFEHPNCQIIGQNFHYDDAYFSKLWGIRCNVKRDTMIRWHTAFPRLEKSLAFISSLLCEHYVFWKDDGKEWDSSIPEEQYWQYCCTDCVRTAECDEVIETILKSMNLVAQADFEQELYWPVRDMMLRGVAQNVPLKRLLSQELGVEVAKRFAWLEDIFGHPINPNSYPQLRALFYDDLAQPRIYNRKTDEVTSDDAALEKLARKEPLLQPVVSVLQQARSLRVFKSTFADSKLDSDNRIRTHFWIPGTSTFRFSSKTNPFGTGANLQNIPKGNETKVLEVLKQLGGQTNLDKLSEQTHLTKEALLEALFTPDRKGLVDLGFCSYNPQDKIVRFLFALPNIRKLFVPDPGYILISADLERAEFQIVVWESEDQTLKELLRTGQDVFGVMAKEIKVERDLVKKMIHAVDNGAQLKKIAEIIKKSIYEAAKIQRNLFAAFPGIAEYHRKLHEELNTKGYVTNVWGFRNYFFDRIASIFPDAASWKPQSTIAITINKAILRVYKEMPEMIPLLQVHDEGVFEVRKELFPACMPRLDELMRVTIPYPDPLVIPLSYSFSEKSWGDLEKYKAT